MNRVEALWQAYWDIRSQGMPPEIRQQMPEIRRAFMAGMHTAFHQLIEDARNPDFQDGRQLHIYLTDLEDALTRKEP